jgi:hypothetical protein
MNSLVALPIAAAVPTIAPPMPPAALPAGVTLQPDDRPDAQLLELANEYERLLYAEKPLKKEKERLGDAACRFSYEKMGVDPDDNEACKALAGHDEWLRALETANREIGSHKAWVKWNQAVEQTAGVGRRIFEISPTTVSGLYVRMRVIETHDEIFPDLTAERMMLEIRDFIAARNLAEGWFVLDVMRKKPRVHDWCALLVDVNPVSDDYRRRPVRECFLSIPGKHKTRDRACDTLDQMISARKLSVG